MTKHRKSLLITIQLCSVLLLTALVASSVRAQTQFSPNDDRAEASRTRSLPRLTFSLMPAGLRGTRATDGGKNAGSSSNASSQMLTAAAPNLQVLGSGTLGRLTKWTGLTSSNSFIGDSTIFESKTGSVGIGTDSPASRLTVAGMIETTLGGFKFPDGTVQTTAAVTGLQAVFHDGTLQGNGTSGSPLGIGVPLNLTAGFLFGPLISATGEARDRPLISATNTGEGGVGLFAVGLEIGVHAVGGDTQGSGGVGVDATGGNSANNFGGDGVRAQGGTGGNGGTGGGGTGISASGGAATGAGARGGDGIFARAGIGSSGAANGFAGNFGGTVSISADLFVTGTKNFRIDHPLDPENKYLYHAAVESSEVLNIYSGNVIANEDGDAIVELPDWFEALNKDFRYQLTPIGAPALGLYIAQKINKGHFKIAGAQPGSEISWQVTGIRSDAIMRRHPFKVEEDKPKGERGTYLSPEAYDQPEELGVEWARHPETMRQMKESREKAIEELKRNRAKQ